MSSLSASEYSRYQRQVSVPEIGTPGQARLRAARVLMIGAGGLGNPALLYLAAAGIGCIGIIDGDTVDQSNLHRQVLFTENDLGALKVEVAATALRARNPYLKVEAHPTPLTPHNAREVIAGYDLILDGSDNFATRYLVNDACEELGKTFIASSILRFEGQLSVYNYLSPHAEPTASASTPTPPRRGPTYRCLFPEPPAAHTVPNCAELGVVGTVPGVLGVLQAHEAIKVLVGFGAPLVGRLLILDLRDMHTREISFSRSSEEGLHAGIRPAQYYQSLAAYCEPPQEINATREQTTMNKRDAEKVAEITAAEVRAWQAQGREFTLLDVREDFERAAASIGGIHIPLAQLPRRLDEVPFGTPVVIYCHSGVRSAHAAELLMRTQQRQDVLNLTGGIVAWLRG